MERSGGAQAHGVTANSAINVFATFQPERTLLVQTDPEGLKFSLDGGVPQPGPATFWLNLSSTHTIAVDTLQSGGPGVQYRYLEWSDRGGPSHAITITAGMTLTARFKTEFYLTVDSSDPLSTGQGWYLTGATAYATVTNPIQSVGPGERLAFQGWGGDATGTDSSGSTSILMDRAHLVVAVWQVQYYLTVETPYGNASGSGWYAAGSFGLASVNSSNIPVSGTQREAFAGWSGDASGSSGALSNPIEMDGPKTARAARQVECLVRIDSDIQVQVDGSGWYAAGTQATLRAPQEVASGGQTYRFSGWTGDVTSSATEVSVTVNGPLVAHANWATVGILGGSTATYGLVAVVVVVAAIVMALGVARSRRRKE